MSPSSDFHAADGRLRALQDGSVTVASCPAKASARRPRYFSYRPHDDGGVRAPRGSAGAAPVPTTPWCSAARPAGCQHWPSLCRSDVVVGPVRREPAIRLAVGLVRRTPAAAAGHVAAQRAQTSSDKVNERERESEKHHMWADATPTQSEATPHFYVRQNDSSAAPRLIAFRQRSAARGHGWIDISPRGQRFSVSLLSLRLLCRVCMLGFVCASAALNTAAVPL